MADEKNQQYNAQNAQQTYSSSVPLAGPASVPVAGAYPVNPNEMHYVSNPNHLRYDDPNIIPSNQVPTSNAQYPGVVGGSTTFVISNTMPFGRLPVRCRCAFCNTEIMTKTTEVNGCVTWMSSGLCCLFGCWLGCCLIPFMVKSLKDVEHSCPNCGAHLGYFQR